jgi:hypothetical protein
MATYDVIGDVHGHARQLRGLLGTLDQVRRGVPMRNERGEWCRSHSAKNLRQHENFLLQVVEGLSEHHYWLDWYRTIPLWLELDEATWTFAVTMPDKPDRYVLVPRHQDSTGRRPPARAARAVLDDPHVARRPVPAVRP